MRSFDKMDNKSRENISRSVVVLGTQWGDEGKGKIVDLLTDRASIVARFQGGHNAGHTLVSVERKQFYIYSPREY